MKQTGFILLMLVVFTAADAQSKLFDASTIPQELKKNASSVKREERIEFEVKSISRAVYKIHRVITVLNEDGKDRLIFQEFSDRFISLGSVSIQLLDSKCATLQKAKRSDLGKQAEGEDLVDDGYIYYKQFSTSSYPVTIEIDYELEFTGLLNYPNYRVQTPGQSVENSVFVAIVPVNLDLRFKAKNTSLSPAVAENGKTKTYTWSCKNLPALEDEAGSVSYESRYPRVMLSPNKFELDGYEGDMSTWQNYGNWYGLLAKKASNLTEERKQFFRNLVKDASNDRDKIKLIYSYLQSNCRYVSIQLGIGGFMPFQADFVDKKKYGDCKALSNYTQACLSAIGIKSHQALINSAYNKEPVDPAFPQNEFNHVILCVPLQKDSVWLECTSNTSEFGVLGSSTENRNALLITEDGGKLVPTPKSKAMDNVFSSTTVIDLAADGSGLVDVTLNTCGQYKQELMYYIGDQKKDDQKEFLVDYMGYLLPDEFDIKYDKEDKKAATILRMSIGKIPEFTAGKKFFLNPRLYKISDIALPKSEHRTQDFYFHHPMIKTDTTIYQLPEGFGIETLPKPKKISFEYGSFTANYQYDESKRLVTSTARLELNEYKIPPAHFSATKTFFNAVLGEYTEKIVIKQL
jgi:hypothetical protein